MIDIESRVYTAVRAALMSAFSDTYTDFTVSAESVDVPDKFPCVTIEEISNTTLQRTQDETLDDNYAVLGYAINVFTNNSSTKKSVAKAIAKVADEAMLELKFNRTLMTPTPNVDRTIYRITMRYEGIVGQPVDVEGTESYPMYRR